MVSGSRPLATINTNAADDGVADGIVVLDRNVNDDLAMGAPPGAPGAIDATPRTRTNPLTLDTAAAWVTPGLKPAAAPLIEAFSFSFPLPCPVSVLKNPKSFLESVVERCH